MSSPKLPFLPGYTFDLDPKKNHHKSQLFAVSSGVRMVDVQYGAQKAAVSDALTSSIKLGDDVSVSPLLDTKDLKAAQATGLLDKEAPAAPSAGPFSSVEAQPAWLANDRKVLRFNAFFQEPVYASPTENFRVRPVIIYYYLSDDTMHIAEPRSDNSGIPQGVLVKRHRLPKGQQGDVYKPQDLQVGAEIEIYGRVYRIVDADPFTRETMKEKLGIELAAAEALPEDPHSALQAGKERSSFNKTMSPQKEFMEATLGRAMGISIDDTKRFLSNDRKVLRFYAVWEDPANNNEKRKYILHYFLADDTVEVKEIQQVNSGRDPMPVLLKRSKLPREYGSTAANVATIGVHADEDKSAFYSAAELRVGKTVNVFNRKLLLSSCDKYTQEYYSANYGLTPADFAALDISDPPKETPTMETPPYTGYGTEEDSLGSFTHLVPKPPRKDTKKLMELDGKNLRYSAKFSSPKEDDKNRSFIVTFFMADDTVSIFERLERNSGFVGGKFLERSRIRDAKTGAFLAPKDFYVGAQLTINNFGFTLLSADEYTLKFMEANPSLYPFADAIQVLSELKSVGAPALSAAFQAVDGAKSGSVSAELLSAVLGGKGLNAHQILALSRTFSADGKLFSYKQMIKSMEELA